MNTNYTKVPSRTNPNVALKMIQGHFVTPHTHITAYMDITTMKTRCSEARQVAELLAQNYSTDTPVDTIICLEGTQVIGTYLAEALTKTGILSYNAHKTIYVVSPEYINSGQIIVRDNMQMAIRGKHVLLLDGAISTGKSLRTAIESLRYYGATVSGACAIFSVLDKIEDIPLHAAFTAADVPTYDIYKINDCPLCKSGAKIDALVNNFGYSEI